MKKIYEKYSLSVQYLVIILLTFFIASCQLLEVEENIKVKNQISQIPKLEVSFGTSSEFNLSSADGAVIDIVLQAKNEFTSNVEIYVALDSIENESVLLTTVANVPSEIQLGISQVRQALQEQDVELENGDVLFFTFRSTIEGEVYQFNETALVTEIICNSMISTAEDTWTGVANAENGASFPSTATAENIKILPLEGDNYLISDISAGWFEAIGFKAQQEGIYADDCNQISWVMPGENRQFEFVEPGTPGTWDPKTQTLTIYWYDEENDFSGQSIFTKDEFTEEEG